MTRALVTGGSGFIGFHLVKQLTQQGVLVRCLVRRSSNRELLEPFDPEFVFGDVTDPASIGQALDDVEIVYHLAGVTKSLRRSEFTSVNQGGVEHVARCCAQLGRPPVLIVVSSLAAAGPSSPDRPRIEADPVAPVSQYGRSKRAGELAAHRFADQVPISIVRPPIVLGQGDRDGFAMFDSIAKLGVHVVPGFTSDRFSVIHAEDLADALIVVAQRGKRIATDPADSQG